jgi:predicted ribosome quality control (RQC) complex YloA/Tae2 family protein
MSFDGVFLHHWLQESRSQIISQRINRLLLIDKQSFVFSLSGHRELFFSLGENSHLRFTRQEMIPSVKTTPFFSVLKKYSEGAVISEIRQHQNDRILILEINSFSELGFITKICLIFEFFGRNANLILTGEDGMIIDCYRKSLNLSENDSRVMLPKALYAFPETDRENPYDAKGAPASENIYQGVSSLVYTEMMFQNRIGIISEPTQPSLIEDKGKVSFSCIPITHLGGSLKVYPTLSELLEIYYVTVRNISSQNSDQKMIENYIRKEKAKAQNKLSKQENELKDAKANLALEEKGNLLSSNLYRVKKGDTEIICENYYKEGVWEKISLNPELSPSENLETIFRQFKKSKRSVSVIAEQIEVTKNELEYLDTLTGQLNLSKAGEIREILEELELTKVSAKARGKKRPQIQTYEDASGNIVMVGKNNIQNNYLTHTLAHKTDYFFHVKGVPGSHTILRCQELTEDAIHLAGTVAAYFSKNRNSTQVAVDYTSVRYVKKVPKTKGSFVTYTNYKTVFVKPDADYIKTHTTSSAYK